MSTTDPPAPSAPVPLREIEPELRRQMNASQRADGAPIVWARMSNLVIFCDHPQASERMAALVPEVMKTHPARVLLLLADRGGGDSAPTGTAQVWCHRGEQKQRIASEQVTIRAAGSAIEHLPFAVRALAIGDLPTNLWWASLQPPALAGPLLDDLAEDAQQVVYDSIGWMEPAKGVAATGSWLTRFERPLEHGRWRIASDLNWRRLKYWRRILGQALDPNSAPGAIESISEVFVEHGPHGVVQAWELVSWLTTRLGWRVQACRVQPNVEISWKAAAAHGAVSLRIHRLSEGEPDLRHVRIACALEGKRGALDLTIQEGRLTVVPEGIRAAPRTLTMPPQDLAQVVARQLSDREEDAVFRETVKGAQLLAQNVLGERAT